MELEDIHCRIFKQRSQWRDWLRLHYADRYETWLGFYKPGVEKECVSNNDAVEEALCFGWFNGKVRRLDDEVYIQRFTPRHARSVWAPSNKQRVEKLLKAGLMTEEGMRLVQLAKENGSWDALAPVLKTKPLVADIRKAFKANPVAWSYFQGLQPVSAGIICGGWRPQNAARHVSDVLPN
ncbi:MAG: hypothetical protein OEX03_06255 [Gammaproteobacteria bacterium]|nr:hypothetical protein [Gammaproteobacteria bacterium]